MPRAFPTQIVGYLSKTFGKPASFDYAIIQSHIGAVAGFLELYDQLPAELIRLSADDYATLITSIATVRYGADQCGNDMFKGAGADKRRSPIAPYLLSNGFCGVDKISVIPRRTKLGFRGIRNQFEMMSYLGVRE